MKQGILPSRNLRVIAYVNQFIKYMKNKRKIDNELNANEINRAELTWIKYIQGKHFSNKRQLNEKQSQSQLNPKIYEDGIIRLYGRFINADLPEDVKLAILLLPRQEHFSKLLIQDMHHKIHHCGLSQTLAQQR